jgi:hypothetical protein
MNEVVGNDETYYNGIATGLVHNVGTTTVVGG